MPKTPAYIIFCEEERLKVLASNPQLQGKPAAILQEIATRWTALTLEQKAHYKDLANSF